MTERQKRLDIAMGKEGAGKNKPKQPPARKKQRKSPEPDTGTYRCACCGTEYDSPRGRFYQTSSALFAGWNGYYPICKSCLNKYWDEVLLDNVGSIDAALDRVCSLMDWYSAQTAIDTTKKIATETKAATIPDSLISIYAGRRAARTIGKAGTTYLDTLRERREKAMIIQDIATDGVDTYGVNDNSVAVDPAVVDMFGPGYKPDEYKYLDEQYKDWLDRYDCKTKAQEELFKTMSVAQLNIRRAQISGDAKDVTACMKAFQELMASAKITPRQNSASLVGEQDTFGTLIREWENERPIPEPSPEFADVDNIRRYISNWFLGHLAKMFGIENDLAAEYEEEIAKYTVEKPRYKDDEDDDLNKYSDVFGSAARNAAKERSAEGGEPVGETQ